MARWPTLELVDALARLRLAAKRAGYSVQIELTPELGDLVEFAGLRLELLGEPEEGEEAGVEEAVVTDDPVA
jgi:hypothetical protein